MNALAPSKLDANLEKTLFEAIELAFREDLGEDGDITTSSIVSADLKAEAVIKVKESCVLAGVEVAKRVFLKLSNDLQYEMLKHDGEPISETPTEVLKVKGPASAILTGERLVLNLMQRMSGVATVTAKFAEKVKGSNIKVLDTRKTTPCLRAFDRLAVAIGGGTNHRNGLYDQILIKDNHIAIAGSIEKAIELSRSAYPDKIIEVETRTMDEVARACQLKPDIILLDNMSREMVVEALKLIDGRAKVEISGGITLETIENYLIDGVYAISVGALTHSAKAIDISLDMNVQY